MSVPKRRLLGAAILAVLLAAAVLGLYLRNRPAAPPSLGLGARPATLAEAYRQFVAVERMPEHAGALRDFPDFKAREANARDMLSQAQSLPEPLVVEAVQAVLDGAPLVYEMERLAVSARTAASRLLAMPSSASQQYYFRQTGARAENHATNSKESARQEVADLEALLHYAESELTIVVFKDAREAAVRNWVEARAYDRSGKLVGVPVPSGVDFTFRPAPRFRVAGATTSTISRAWGAVHKDGQPIGRKPANSLEITWAEGLPRQLFLNDWKAMP